MSAESKPVAYPFPRTRQIMRVVAKSAVEGVEGERAFALRDAARAAIEQLEAELEDARRSFSEAVDSLATARTDMASVAAMFIDNDRRGVEKWARGISLDWTDGKLRQRVQEVAELLGQRDEAVSYAETLHKLLGKAVPVIGYLPRTAKGCDYQEELKERARAALAKNPNEYSAHPASGNAGVKLTPAETVRYDPAPECKGDIAARERLEPKGRQGVDGTSAHIESDAQYGVTAGETATNTKGCHEIGVTFADAWATMEARGFRYGDDALEQVRLGWEMCQSATRGTLPGLKAHSQ